MTTDETSCVTTDETSCVATDETSCVATDETSDNNINDNINDTSTSIKTNKNSILEAAAEIKKIITDLFDGIYAFDNKFVPELLQLFNEFRIQKHKEFLMYVLKRTQDMKPTSRTNLFRRLAVSPNIYSDYLDFSGEHKEENKVLKITKKCPVCGKDAARFGICQNCDFEMSFCDNKAQVALARQIFHLPVEKRKNLKKELNHTDYYENPLDTNLMQKINSIYLKYGIDREKIRKEAIKK